QSSQRLRAARLGITIGLATLLFVVLQWGLRETPLARADPGTLYVDWATGQDIGTCGTMGTPCETISYTLNSRAVEGDTILIAEGTYTENLTIAGITVTLRGGYTVSGGQWLADTGETVVDGGGAGRVFFIHNSNSVLENLTITGGDAPPAEAWGGGVWVTGGDVTIRYSTILDNGDADWSMGIEVNDDYGLAHLTLESSFVGRNYGGGLHLWSSGAGTSVDVEDVTFFCNRSGTGGGIRLEQNSSAVIMNSVIFSNTADWGGGIAVTNNSTATIAYSRIVSNTANEGGGGLYASGVTVTLRSNDFLSNTSQTDDGPAMWAAFSTLAADYNLFAHNVSNASWGGGAVRLWQSTMALTNSVVAQNQASGFQVTQSSLGLVNNTIVSNTADGINLWDSGIVSLLRNNIIADNGNYAVGGDGTVSLSEYNDLWNNPGGTYEMLTVTLGSGNIALDPQFVDVANGDYHLQADSPCIDTGTSTGAPMEDFEEDPRPLDGNMDGTAAVDIGADEFKLPQVFLPLTLGNT
ncbi:MAG: right-handed parallel beta-helix repeat-containing protein, partial [Anaerolineae bacterium]